MSSWSIRVSVVAVMLLSFAGCDPNAGGPGAPTTPVENAGSGSVPGEKGVPKTKSKVSRTVEGPKPTPID